MVAEYPVNLNRSRSDLGKPAPGLAALRVGSATSRHPTIPAYSIHHPGSGVVQIGCTPMHARHRVETWVAPAQSCLPMARRLLHALLALTLALNGISAPWAMAAMNPGMHGGAHEAHNLATTGTSTPSAMLAHDHGDHGAHSAAIVTSDPASPPDSDSGR